MPLENLKAQNPDLNQTLAIGRALCQGLAQAGFLNPRLYGNEVSLTATNQAGFIPEHKVVGDTAPFASEDQTLDALPWKDEDGWAKVGVPDDMPIYLQFFVDDCRDYFNVGQTVIEIRNDLNTGLFRLAANLATGGASSGKCQALTQPGALREFFRSNL